MQTSYSMLTSNELVRTVSNEDDLNPREKAMLVALERAVTEIANVTAAVTSLNAQIAATYD